LQRSSEGAHCSDLVEHWDMSALPWAQAPQAALAQVLGVFTDIDDTLTKDGAIEPVALEALHRLRAANLPVVAITGRPWGWSQPFAAAWPVAAIVAENGAVALINDNTHNTHNTREGGAVTTLYAQDPTTRARNAVRLGEVAQRILREVPGAQLAQDSPGRVTDIAIDHSEFTPLNPAQIEAVVNVMQSQGMHATVSSIHINGWFGEHDKCSGARWMVEHLFRRRLDDERDRWLYVGDSTNDQAMFGAFAHTSVGVANLRRFADALHTWPRYITERERGHGFAEVVDTLLRARTTPDVAHRLG
jgi:HAD superfamily hydrolase (TIGR01484 family)